MANVSTGTVDRVLHNRGQVAQENIAKVQAIIKEYGYKPNILASNLALNKKFRLAVFLPNPEQLEYWNLQIKGIKKAAAEYDTFGIELQYFLYDFNTESFNNCAVKVLNVECEALLFAPIFKEESFKFLESFKDRNLPIVLVDSQLPTNNQQTFIGQNAFDSGYLAGRLLSFAVRDPWHILILKNTIAVETTSVYLQRIAGFYAYFKDHPALNHVRFTEVSLQNSSTADLKASTFDAVNSVFVPNSRAYILAEFLEQNQIKHVRVLGYDLLEQNIRFLQSDYIDFLINQRPEEQGYMAVTQLYKKLVLQEELKAEHFMALDIIMKENYRVQ